MAKQRVRHAGGMDHARRRQARQAIREHANVAATARGARWRAGCSPGRWRRRAASRCRPSTPSARGCCSSSRSRPMSPRASACSTRPSNRSSWSGSRLRVLLEGAAAPDSALARALATAMTAAADQTFRDVVREAIGQARRHRSLDRMAPARRGARSQTCRKSSASIRPTTLDEIEAEISTARSSHPRNGRRSPQLAQGGKTDREQAERFARLAALAGGERVETYLEYFLHRQRARRANPSSPKAIDDTSLAERLAAEQEPRLRAARTPPRRRLPRPQRGAAHRHPRGAHALAAEKERRGLLDYDDLIDKARRCLPTSTPPGCTTSSISASTMC